MFTRGNETTLHNIYTQNEKYNKKHEVKNNNETVALFFVCDMFHFE